MSKFESLQADNVIIHLSDAEWTNTARQVSIKKIRDWGSKKEGLKKERRKWQEKEKERY